MNIRQLLVSASTVLAVAVIPTTVSAQALSNADAFTDIYHLMSEYQRSDVLATIHDYQSRCEPLDPDTRVWALTELNRFDQRAVDLANRSSYQAHMRAQSLAWSIESVYSDVLNQVTSPGCYVAADN